jgi:hypothetical protein
VIERGEPGEQRDVQRQHDDCLGARLANRPVKRRVDGLAPS